MVVYTRCFWIDRATRCLPVPPFSRSVSVPRSLCPCSPRVQPLPRSTRGLADLSSSSCSLSLFICPPQSLCARVSASSWLVQAQGSCVRNGNYFLRRNKPERPGLPPIREEDLIGFKKQTPDNADRNRLISPRNAGPPHPSSFDVEIISFLQMLHSRQLP